MNKKTKRSVSLVITAFIINVLIAAGIVCAVFFGPAGAKENVKGALEYMTYCGSCFQVKPATIGVGLGPIEIAYALSMYLVVLLTIILIIVYAAKKQGVSVLAAFNLLITGAIVFFGLAMYFVGLSGKLGTLSMPTLIIVVAVAALIGVAVILCLAALFSATKRAINKESDAEGEELKAKVAELEERVAALEGKVKELEERPVAVAAVAEEAKEEPAEEAVEEPKEPVNFTVEMVKNYVAGMSGEDHPVATENKDANGGNGPVSNNVGVCNMSLTYGKENVSSLLIRLEADKAEEYKKAHSVEASNFAGSGDYYKLLVNDGSYTEEAQLWEIMEASYAYVLGKYFKIEDGEYVAVEEEPVEEVKEEPAPAPVVEEPAPVVEEEPEEEKVIIERVPFADKVRRSDRDLKNKYDELKAYLLSYGLKSRISIDGDTYRLHTVKYVHITIAGKKMKVYFALNPNDYLTSTTPVKEAKAKKYSEVKAYLDVKSDLSVKRAKALIDTVMQNAGIEKAAE